MKFKILVLTIAFLAISNANMAGPYIMWGHEKVQILKLPTPTEADEQSLVALFTEAQAIVVFVRNKSVRLDTENYPKFHAMIGRTVWAYLPQYALAVEPFGYKSNTEVIHLAGTHDEQDEEIVTRFQKYVAAFGESQVLAIMAYREEYFAHYVYKREINNEEVLATTMTATEDSIESSFIYRAPGNAIFYTTAAPLLNMDINGVQYSYSLVEHEKDNTFDDYSDWGRLNIDFRVNNSRLRLRFNFTMDADSYWSLRSVELDYKEYQNVMPLVEPVFEAPSGFSYRCATRSLFFRNEKDNLTIIDFQVQPWLKGANRFSEAYDCIGFTTIPIWSSLFVCIIMVSLLFVGILALVDIKPPGRFKSPRNKKVTFKIQE